MYRMRRQHAAIVLLALTTGLTTRSPAAQRTPLTGQFERGPFTLTFTDDNRYTLTSGGKVGVEGVAKVDGDTVIVQDTSGPMACKPDISGRYTWSTEKAVLTMKVSDDACEGRRNGLAGGPWTRKDGEAEPPLAVLGATLIDGTGAPPRSNSVVVMAGGRIVDIFSVGEKPVPPGATVVGLNGRWIVPGLIDAHVHLATDPETTNKRADVERQLERALLGGVTAVRDMAGDVRVLADLARSANLQRIPSPAIWYSALVGGPPFFEDPRARNSARGARAGALPWSRAATPATDWRLMIAEARGSGAQGIKLYAALPADVVQPITEEAHRQGLRVWSHAALFPARPRDIVAAGVDVLSHAALLVWDTEERLPDYTQRGSADYAAAPSARLDDVLKEMAARGTMLEPTLHVSFARDAHTGRWSAAITRRAHRLGVPLVAGTDGMGAGAAGELPNLHRELELLVTEAGLSPLEAIVAATRNAARALGIEQSHGTVAVGKTADLVVLKADPTADVTHTREIACVIRGGRMYTPRNAGKGCGADPS